MPKPITPTSSTPGVQARVAAAGVLDAVLHRGRSLKAEFAAVLPGIADTRDRALVEAICFAALRLRGAGDAAIKAWIPKPLGHRDGDLRALLLAGFAQLGPMALPAHAAVAATVDAARGIGRAHQAKLVNALLRRMQRDGLPEVAIDAGWPAWLRKRVLADWPAEYAAIIEASAQPAAQWLRVNATHGTRDAYRAQLDAAGIESKVVEGLDDALCVAQPRPVAALPGFADGRVSVQDGAAQALADALTPPRGACVLDACAAPGGKAAHLLERDPALRLLALDIDATRLDRVRGTFARLGIGEHATLQRADVADLDAWWDGVAFDAVLLDAPCSATGIVRRQPDVLLHRRETDIDALVALQAKLLDACWHVLAPGGVLLYATCSILRAENDAQVDAFLVRTPDALVDALAARFGRASGKGRQRLPGEGGMDGFFQARLRKRA